MGTSHRLTLLLSLCLVIVAALGVQAAAQAQDVQVIQTLTPDQVHSLVSENQGKVVIVNFWASWCPPCLKEFPDIIRVYNEHHAEGLEVIAVSMNADDEIQDIEDFLANYEPPCPIYRAATQDETFFSGISDEWYGEMPTTLVFDAEGDTVGFYKRQLTYEEMTTDVTDLLSRRSAVN